MNGKMFVWLLATILLTTASAAEAQEGKKVPWIGYLAGSGAGPSPVFMQGLRALG